MSYTAQIRAKCPHDVVADEVDRVAMRPTEAGEFAVLVPPLVFQCSECKAYSEGYNDAVSNPRSGSKFNPSIIGSGSNPNSPGINVAE